MPRVNGKKEKFGKSASKALLRADILRERVTEQTNARTIYNSNDEHKKWVFKNWEEAFNRLMAAVKRDRSRMEADTLAYGHDLAIVKISRPADVAWHRSPACRLLKADVDAGKHTSCDPSDLWLTSPEYQAFDLACFRKHLYQEIDSRPKRAIRFEKKKKTWLYPELHEDHPRMQTDNH